MPKYTITVPISLQDTTYFCNKSWTLSYNMNTKSWISFHSYLPNWYIGESNFFYSGVNGCCDDFDFIAAELPSTFDCRLWGVALLDGCSPECDIEGYACLVTTTTTTSTSSTTTSTTTLYPPCYLEGSAQEMCYTTSTTTSTTTECIRPEGLEMFSFITGHTIGGVTVDSTVDEDIACYEMHWLLATPDPAIVVNYIVVEAASINVEERVYLLNGTSDCTCIPDGWYFTDETMSYDYVFHVVDCVIVEYFSCATTTTTTTLTPTTTTTTTQEWDCELAGEAYEVCTTTTTTTLPPTTTTTTSTSSTTTTTTTCYLGLEFVETLCEDCELALTILEVSFITTTTTTTVEPTTTTTTTVEPTTTTTTTFPIEFCTGAFYNFYAVDNANGLAPTGWHVPSKTEWEELNSYLDSVGLFCDDGTNEGAAASLAYNDYWESSWSECHPGFLANNNATCFSALPSAERDSMGNFHWMGLGYTAYWWSSTVATWEFIYGYYMFYNSPMLSEATNYYGWGRSIRCVKDSNEGWQEGDTVTDYDGNIYGTIKIGNQIWTQQNLNVTHYRNGTVIPVLTDNTDWANDLTGAMCYWQNHPEYGCLEIIQNCVQDIPTTTTTTTIEPTTTTTTTTIEETTTTTTTTP